MTAQKAQRYSTSSISNPSAEPTAAVEIEASYEPDPHPTFLLPSATDFPDRQTSRENWLLPEQMITYTQAENNNLELTCSKAGQPACSKSDQTWEEAYQACRFHLFPGCSRSPPCRTHDSAPGCLNLQRSSCPSPTSPPAPPPPDSPASSRGSNLVHLSLLELTTWKGSIPRRIASQASHAISARARGSAKAKACTGGLRSMLFDAQRQWQGCSRSKRRIRVARS